MRPADPAAPVTTRAVARVRPIAGVRTTPTAVARTTPLAAVLLASACGAPPAATTPAPQPIVESRGPLHGTLPEIPARGTPVPPTSEPITVRYPPRDAAVATDSTFVFGQLDDPSAVLTINGATVPVEPNGAFLAYLPVPGDGLYRFRATGQGGPPVDLVWPERAVADKGFRFVSGQALHLAADEGQLEGRRRLAEQVDDGARLELLAEIDIGGHEAKVRAGDDSLMLDPSAGGFDGGKPVPDRAPEGPASPRPGAMHRRPAGRHSPLDSPDCEHRIHARFLTDSGMSGRARAETGAA